MEEFAVLLLLIENVIKVPVHFVVAINFDSRKIESAFMSNALSSSGIRKNTPCSFFVAGKCRNGTSCKFFHSSREDQAINPLPCKFFLQGTCTAGRECKFSHEAKAQVRATLVSSSTGEKTIAPGSYGILCKFFKFGNCSSGNKCPYLHTQKTDSEKRQREVKVDVKPKAKHLINNIVDEEKEMANLKLEAVGEKEQKEMKEDIMDFISKEEELYYYGAPGEFEDTAAEAVLPMPKKSYAEITRKNMPDRPLSFDEELPAPPKICTFFLQGSCRYGKTCFYAHSLPENVGSEEEMRAKDEELRLSQDLECGICYEKVIGKGERFGLLSGCNHSFCLTCLRNWRGNADQPKQTVRQCPICRLETSFIIPSSRMITNPERKKALSDVYLKNLSVIPCRHFDEGRYYKNGRLGFLLVYMYGNKVALLTEEHVHLAPVASTLTVSRMAKKNHAMCVPQSTLMASVMFFAKSVFSTTSNKVGALMNCASEIWLGKAKCIEY
ncbi:hypothetical protein PsorP6_003387 [Peronosclerospora sorghi]|uniref:Uncharacterized protein n=1 Tax=Peronosclerospora sorghi TaxID=230839 RepID=A0ACC0VMK0_9STRA|nr:hypothetical protein PsorP6_003387 [Peronosclerospora sorghi]